MIKIEESNSIELHRPQCKLEEGVDFSAMCSIVTAPRGYLYCLKEFHTLVPENEINWVKFSGFYKHHKNKELDMY
jgi:hypothetical protein